MAVAQMIANNKAIRYSSCIICRVIDLENNNLLSENDNSGILQLAESLRTNDTLLSLNLNNTNLDEKAGMALVRALEENESIIMLDIENNPKIGLTDVRRVQELLKRNKKSYDDER
jgi:ABC-type iron transport system FetAB ATPase subunit